MGGSFEIEVFDYTSMSKELFEVSICTQNYFSTNAIITSSQRVLIGQITLFNSILCNYTGI